MLTPRREPQRMRSLFIEIVVFSRFPELLHRIVQYWISLVGRIRCTFGPNRVYFHGGEMPGYNSFMGYDPVNDVTLIIWTSLTISLDGQPTANTLMLKMLDQIYAVSPLQQAP